MNDAPGVDPMLVGKWLRGWAASREKPPPVAVAGGWRVEVNEPDQRARYVFPQAGEEARAFMHDNAPPLTPIKICAPPDAVAALLAPPWVIDRVAPMMQLPALRAESDARLGEGYALTLTGAHPIILALAIAGNGDVAAGGRLVLIDDVAVFDQIQTSEAYRRKGLGRAVMRGLESAAAQRGARLAMLVATEAGCALYTSIGWRVCCAYTTVIVAPAQP